MCDTSRDACSPSCAGGRTAGALAGAGLAALAVASASPSLAALGRVLLDVCGGFAGLVVVLAVTAAWRAGAAAWASARALRAAVWTYTHTRALSSAARRYAGVRARRRLAARDVKALPMARQGPGVGISGAMSSPLLSGAVIPRSRVLTTGPTTRSDNSEIRVTTGPYRLGEDDRIVVVVDEAFTLAGADLDVLADLIRMGRKP